MYSLKTVLCTVWRQNCVQFSKTVLYTVWREYCVQFEDSTVCSLVRQYRVQFEDSTVCSLVRQYRVQFEDRTVYSLVRQYCVRFSKKYCVQFEDSTVYSLYITNYMRLQIFVRVIWNRCERWWDSLVQDIQRHITDCYFTKRAVPVITERNKQRAYMINGRD